ncbi:LOW QUALITY PROTEIN: hypothetical protein RJ641_009007 [Dillenia turbinata]|uniref:Uncharacterized protein n=1 Tax=Dillenia turbinata TaxID=194707 RepID=A0AAN8V715_9MAGN
MESFAVVDRDRRNYSSTYFKHYGELARMASIQQNATLFGTCSSFPTTLILTLMPIHRCVYESSSKDDTLKLFPDEVEPEYKRLLMFLLQKFQEWQEEVLKERSLAIMSSKCKGSSLHHSVIRILLIHLSRVRHQISKNPKWLTSHNANEKPLEGWRQWIIIKQRTSVMLKDGFRQPRRATTRLPGCSENTIKNHMVASRDS